MMPVILYLLLAHFLIDWCWQGDFIANNKHKNWIIMCAHVTAWSLGICAVLSYFGLFAWWKLAMLFIGHWIEDLYKAKKVAFFNDKGHMMNGSIERILSGSNIKDLKETYFNILLLIDQGFHIVQLGVCLL